MRRRLDKNPQIGDVKDVSPAGLRVGPDTNASQQLIDDAHAELPSIVAIRRRIHRHPEVGLQLPNTQKVILDALRSIGLDAEPGRRISSVTSVIGVNLDGPVTILRADMDALSLTEQSGLDFASEIPGVMHACGHDGHVAMLLGAASLLTRRVDELPGPVLLVFQPGEEGYFGARIMLEEGLLDRVDCNRARAFAIHLLARLPVGEILIRPGTILAAADRFRITVTGRGGHASAPHRARDPISVAAEIILALQSAVTREVDVFDPAVVSIAHVKAGSAYNIIPDSAFLEGTFRTISAAQRDAIGSLISRVAAGVARAHDTSAVVEHDPLYPCTVNDDAVVSQLIDIGADVVGAGRVRHMEAPEMLAEDFSYVLERVRGAYVFLGARDAGVADPVPDNHSDRAVFDESALAVGAALYARVAIGLARSQTPGLVQA